MSIVKSSKIMISITIPAYNEEKRIMYTLDLYASYFIDNYSDLEIIVICDGHDKTAGIVRSMVAKYTNIKLFEFPSRLGKGGAIIEGFKKSNGNILCFIDADEAVLPNQVEKMIAEIKNFDCIIASRRIEGANILKRPPLLRGILSRGLNIFCNVLFSLEIKDTQCGAKVFKKEVIEKVIPKLKLTGFEFDIDLLWRIKNEGFSIKEAPIEWKHMDHSSFSVKYVPIMFVNLIKIRLGR